MQHRMNDTLTSRQQVADAEIARLQAEVRQWRTRFERAVSDSRLQVEVEDGAACMAFFDGVLVTNGQSDLGGCFDDAYSEVWGTGMGMRPEFAAHYHRAKAQAVADRHRTLGDVVALTGIAARYRQEAEVADRHVDYRALADALRAEAERLESLARVAGAVQCAPGAAPIVSEETGLTLAVALGTS